MKIQGQLSADINTPIIKTALEPEFVADGG